MKYRLSRAAKKFAKLYNDKSIGVLGYSGFDGPRVHMEESGLKKLFPDTELEMEPLNDDYNRIFTNYRGVRFFALVDKEEK